MPIPTALVVTSINPPNAILRALADGARRADVDFIVAGDTKSPPDFALDGCRFLDIEAQQRTGFAFAAACPTRHYARKNVGYLAAVLAGARRILETDDDNWPRETFFQDRQRHVEARGLAGQGWANIYRYFSEATIWPRGLPLDAIHDPLPPFDTLDIQTRDCPIQQGLADENPDVDAVYRLALPLPQSFRHDRQVAIGRGAWCPFNSQNTTWWSDAFPLLYLPAFCSFRMTDIWRSFVAQRIGVENGWWVLFHEPSVWQERNEHNLMKDFADEVPGYLHNRAIGEALDALPLQPGAAHLGDNMRRCYEALVRLTVVGEEELALLDAWLADIRTLTGAA
jgi:STELLO glycosyltransferases